MKEIFSIKGWCFAVSAQGALLAVVRLAGPCPKSKLQEASQGPALQTDLLRQSSFRSTMLTPSACNLSALSAGYLISLATRSVHMTQSVASNLPGESIRIISGAVAIIL